MNIILTGDRPTGKLHLGHYVGSLKNRVKLQNDGDYDEMYIMIADGQALTDNFDNPKKIKENLKEVMLDYLSVGLDPNKVTFFIQSEVPALTELTFYYMNLVTVSRVQRNPTVKAELKQKSFANSIPVGFMCYPISQAADITAFKANIIPVGDDQLPMLEQTNEIVRLFNKIYDEVLVYCKPILPNSMLEKRLPGLDGNAKMSKSLGNCIYLSDTPEEVKRKVMSMYTDPKHIKVDMPGKVEGNMVFKYLDIFASDEQIKKYSEFSSLQELKNKYTMGGLGDVKIKKILIEVIEELLVPFREKRQYYESRMEEVKEILRKGTIKAKCKANETLREVKNAMTINYFE